MRSEALVEPTAPGFAWTCNACPFYSVHLSAAIEHVREAPSVYPHAAIETSGDEKRRWVFATVHGEVRVGPYPRYRKASGGWRRYFRKEDE